MGYYPFYAWAKLLDRGTQVRADITWAETPGCGHPDAGNDLYVTAAVARGGHHAVVSAPWPWMLTAPKPGGPQKAPARLHISVWPSVMSTSIRSTPWP